ncbi:MAG: hypothetical protein GXX99_03665 [Clostridiales bacterium]|nr:hypothetical protein [Clostridiales bacterium]
MHDVPAEPVAGALCYLLGWITGIVFFLVDRRPSVRFHAAQSILTFGALSLLTVVLGRSSLFLPLVLWRLLGLLNALTGIGGVALALFLMLQAYRGNRYHLPVAGAYAEKLAEK